MSYQVQPGNFAGRLGEGLGKGLAEQIPKETEHYRLSQGLRQLQEEGKNLSPSDFYTRAASIYGATPEMQRQLGELARERQRGENFVKKGKIEEEQKPKFLETTKPEIKETTPGKAPSITTSRGIQATVKPFIPRDFSELRNAAAVAYEANPAFYSHNPQNAIAEQAQIDQQELLRSEALQGERKGQQDVQTTVKEGLDNQIKSLKAKIPANVKSNIEDKAIKSVLPVEEGGEGLTEQEALKQYGEEADAISRDYEALNTLGNYSFLANNPKNAMTSIKNLRSKFKDRDDLENFADTLVGTNGLSVPKGYYLAYPINENKDLNNFIVKLPDAHRTQTEDPVFETRKIAPQISKTMNKEDSPLAIYEELNAKGYSGDEFLKYLTENRKSLNLSERQGRELDKPRNWYPNLNDMWLFTFLGLDKLVEQK